MDPRQFFEQNLHIIEEAIRLICSRRNINGEEAEEFGALVKLRLVEDDYKIIRDYKGISLLKTYLYAAINHIFIDYLREKNKRWRPSTRAQELGEAAVRLEELLYRDHYRLVEAHRILTVNHHIQIDMEQALDLYKELPDRSLRGGPKFVDMELDTMPGAGNPAGDFDHKRLSDVRDKVEEILEELRRAFSHENSLLLRMRFEDGMKISAIARVLGKDRAVVDQRLKIILAKFKEGILAKGIPMDDVMEIMRLE